MPLAVWASGPSPSIDHGREQIAIGLKPRAGRPITTDGDV